MKPRDKLEALLEETGELTEVRALAAKKILTADIACLMKRRGISKAQLARRMGTARPVIDRLLDPRQSGVTLTTLAKAASVLGAICGLGYRQTHFMKSVLDRPSRRGSTSSLHGVVAA